jgi:hypothetical protein
LRFYTVGSLATEIEASLPPGHYRIRRLRDNDDNFDYSIPPDLYPQGCYEIELVLQKITPPTYADVLELSSKAKTMVAIYVPLIETILADANAAGALDTDILAAFGREFPIPPYSVIKQLFPAASDARLRQLLWPLVDPAIVDAAWYPVVHPDVRDRLASGEITDIGEHYRRAGYFERKLPRKTDHIYG